MHNAPQEAKLLAYTSLCRPILKYADVAWDPSIKSKVHDIELIQNKAIRFIANLRGRDDSVIVTRERLKLESLEKKRKNHRGKITACVYSPGYFRLRNSITHY